MGRRSRSGKTFGGRVVNADAVHAYRKEHNGSRTKIAKLTPPDGGSNTQFGGSVSLSDGIIAVGAKWSDQHGHSNSGAGLSLPSPAGLVGALPA